jgi:hypothetical protein
MPQDIESGPERKGGLLNQTRNFLFGEDNENHNQIQNLTSDKGGGGKRLQDMSETVKKHGRLVKDVLLGNMDYSQGTPFDTTWFQAETSISKTKSTYRLQQTRRYG